MEPSAASVSHRQQLNLAVATFALDADEIRSRAALIHQEVLRTSSALRAPNFTAIHTRDLEFLFESYDRHFLDGRCRAALDSRKLSFRLSKRMTRSGGTTTQFRHRSGESSYEIAVAVSILYDSFHPGDPAIKVCGLECTDRLQGLQRIFEHELTHLVENLIWGTSECSAPRFQDIARRLFLHRSHRHELITRRDRAAKLGLRVGSRVVFEFQGRRLEGRINRITKRASVLVEDPEGRRYSDGRRYSTYYIPITALQ